MASINAREHRVVRRINVAIRAGGTIVRNPEIGVIEHRAEPRLSHPRRMARGASRRVGRRHVIRHSASIGLRIRVIRLMAAVTIRGRIACAVIASEMAVRAGIDHGPDGAGHGRARWQHMRPLQGKARSAVVKLSVRPEHGVVARGAKRSRKSRGNVVRDISAKRRRAVPGRLVAAIAIRIR